MCNNVIDRQTGFDMFRGTLRMLWLWGLGLFLLTAPQVSAAADIPQDLLETVRSDGTAEFFVVLNKQADVSYAYQLQTKEEKGKYVFETLTRTARETQADIIQILEARNVE
ncbi:MAG TPA: hypothetical protein PLV45_17385, partial [bacterium]|nr:hypothetical protein [bacterium]